MQTLAIPSGASRRAYARPGAGTRLRPAAWLMPAPQPATAAAETWSRYIVAVAAQQDRESFAALFRHFAPRVKSYLLRCHVPPPLAEELAQETMLAVWRKAATFDPARASASTWIFTIARNLRVDALRGTPHPQSFSEEAALISDEPLASDQVLAQERDARMREALTSLPEEQAHVVRLSFFDDKPHAEIARELGVPLGTVKSRLRLAYARLKAALESVR